MEYSEDLLWHGHEKQMGYSMICPEMVWCHSIFGEKRKENFGPAVVEDLVQQVVMSKLYSRETFRL